MCLEKQGKAVKTKTKEKQRNGFLKICANEDQIFKGSHKNHCLNLVN